MNAGRTTARTTVIAALAAGFAAAASAAPPQYGNVVSATPVSSTVAVPRQECFDSEQVVQRQPSGAGALIGAIVGGVAGNQIGHGFGRTAATGFGAVAGSAIGNNVEANGQPVGTVPVRNCRTVNAYENRLVGYDVVYDYAGQRYTTRTDRDPGPRLALDVRPAAAPLDNLGPPATYASPPPVYAESAPPPTGYYDQQAPAYYAPAQAYAPAPAYYGGYAGPAAYVAPAVIGLGLGYWAGSRWYGGPRYHGGRGNWNRYRR